MIEYIPYLFLFLQLAAAEIVFLIKAEKRAHFWVKLPLSLVVGGIACYFAKYITVLEWGVFLIPLLLSFAAILISYKISVFHAILFAVIAYALQNCAFNIANVVCSFFAPVDIKVIEICSIAALALILLACWFLTVRSCDYKSIFAIKNMGMMCVCFVVLVLIVFLHSKFNADTAETIGRVFLIISVFLSVFLIFGISTRSRLSKEKTEIEQLLKKEENLHRLSKENIDMINMKCHDLKHRIVTIRAERGKNDFGDIDDALDIYDSFIKTGNEDLDIVLAEKSLYCKKYGILLSCIIDGRQLSFMSSGDVYSLFGNAFDNAIERLKTEPAEKRVISLGVQLKGEFLGVRMENYCGKKLDFSGGLPVTDKPDKDFHGFGMKSIKYITEKYDGSMLVEQRGNMFVLSIMFPKKVCKN